MLVNQLLIRPVVSKLCWYQVVYVHSWHLQILCLTCNILGNNALTRSFVMTAHSAPEMIHVNLYALNGTSQPHENAFANYTCSRCQVTHENPAHHVCKHAYQAADAAQVNPAFLESSRETTKVWQDQRGQVETEQPLNVTKLQKQLVARVRLCPFNVANRGAPKKGLREKSQKEVAVTLKLKKTALTAEKVAANKVLHQGKIDSSDDQDEEDQDDESFIAKPAKKFVGN